VIGKQPVELFHGDSTGPCSQSRPGGPWSSRCISDNDQDMKDYRAFMKQWAPSEPEAEGLAMHDYVTAK
jgi:hypothetical protein